MKLLLAFAKGVDAMNAWIGRAANWLILAAVLISASNALIRKLFSVSSNAWLEIQWYLFGAVVMLGAAHTLRMNEHVRVDLIYGAVSERKRLWIDTLGLIFFLLPFALFAVYLCWPVFVTSWRINEGSNNAGGLLRWPIKLIMVAGFATLALQGISELIKRIAALRGVISFETAYERPLQ